MNRSGIYVKATALSAGVAVLLAASAAPDTGRYATASYRNFGWWNSASAPSGSSVPASIAAWVPNE